MRRLLSAAAVAVVLAAASCSNSPSGELKASAAPALQQEVQRAREAVASNDGARLKSALDELRSLVRKDEANGTVSSSRANDILDAADKLQQDFDNQQTPSPTPTTSSPAPTTPPPTTPPPTTPPPTTAPPTTAPPTSPPVTVSIGPGGGGQTTPAGSTTP